MPVVIAPDLPAEPEVAQAAPTAKTGAGAPQDDSELGPAERRGHGAAEGPSHAGDVEEFFAVPLCQQSFPEAVPWRSGCMCSAEERAPVNLVLVPMTGPPLPGAKNTEVSPSVVPSHPHQTHRAGYYQLDPQRMYVNYHSATWDQPMPYSMFFNWEKDGIETGLAIHAASGTDIAKLGSRASAGCVHLSPEHARLLYNLIHADYRGPTPRFAYDAARETLSNKGELAHDKAGNVKMADGYQVLIFIENFGGENVVAALDLKRSHAYIPAWPSSGVAGDQPQNDDDRKRYADGPEQNRTHGVSPVDYG